MLKLNIKLLNDSPQNWPWRICRHRYIGIDVPGYSDYTSLFVRWLSGSFARCARFDLSNSTNSIFIKSSTDVQHLCQISALTFERSRSNAKVKNHRIKSLRTVSVMSAVHGSKPWSYTARLNSNVVEWNIQRASRLAHFLRTEFWATSGV